MTPGWLRPTWIFEDPEDGFRWLAKAAVHYYPHTDFSKKYRIYFDPSEPFDETSLRLWDDAYPVNR